MGSQKGFSLVEALAVVALVVIAAGVSMVQMRSSIAIVDADRAVNLVSAQLRYARQVAVDQRRNVLVEFIDTTEIRITRQDGGGATTVLSNVFLPAGFTFAKPTGVADTPDGYGNATPVFFNLSNRGTFLADGIFVNDAGIVTNGTVFTMGAGTGTARAVTLTGASGRNMIYWLEGSVWSERT